jgi:hypothetical protein
MKKLIVVSLLMSLNLYTMEYFKNEDKPYKKYRNQILQTLDIDQHEYNELKKVIKKRNPGCFTGLSHALSTFINFKKQYDNK